MVNMQKLRNNRTGFKGVYYCMTKFRYKAQIGVQNTRRYLGSFYTAEEAGRAYAVAAVELFGEHALTNARLGLFAPAPAAIEAPAMQQVLTAAPAFKSHPGVPDMPLPFPHFVPHVGLHCQTTTRQVVVEG